MKCKKCAGDLPYGTYGKVKCEYCNTINNVPTPEQEREKKVEVGEASGRKWVTAAVVIVILGIVGSVAAFVPLISVAEYYTDTEMQMKTVSYQEKEPYTVLEAYTEKEPYSATEKTYNEVPYEDEKCTWVTPNVGIDWGDFTFGYYTAVDVEVTNGEGQSVTVYPLTVTFRDNDMFSSTYGLTLDTVTKYVTLTPFQTKYVTFTSNLRTKDYSVLTDISESTRLKIEKCETVTKFKNVANTETVTKYRDATKYRDVTKYKTVTKTKEVPEQVQVSKTRTVKKTLLDYLMAQPWY